MDCKPDHRQEYRRTANGPVPAPGLGARFLTLVVLCGLLGSGFSGRAGVQVLDQVLAQRLFATHTHGVLAEQAYVERYGTQAPFVQGHCHNEPALAPDTVFGPHDASAAVVLAVAAICGAIAATPLPPEIVDVGKVIAATTPPDVVLAPPTEPPRVIDGLAGNAPSACSVRIGSPA